jgi:hypothetical protein
MQFSTMPSNLINLSTTHICVCERRLKNTPEIHFIYLGNKEIYCVFETFVLSLIYFP